MLQPKNIKKNKLVLAKNFYLADLIALIFIIFFSFVLGWFSIPDFLYYKKIISSILILLLLLFFSPLMFFLPSENLRVWLFIWYYVKYFLVNKKYLKNSKKSNTAFFTKYKNIDEKGILELKTKKINDLKYVSFLEIKGLNIWNHNFEDKKYILNQITSFFNILDFKISFVKIKTKNDFNKKINEIKTRLSTINDKEKNITSDEKNEFNYLFFKKKEFEKLNIQELNDKYIIAVYDKDKGNINNNILQIINFFKKIEIDVRALNNVETYDFLYTFHNIVENKNIDKNLKEIVPKKIFFKKNHFILNNIYSKITSISEYALDLNVGWADTFFNSTNTFAIWHISPIINEDYEKILDKANDKILTSIAFNKKSIYRSKKDFKFIEAIDEIMDLVSNQNQKIFDTNLLFLTFADTKSNLKNTLKNSLYKNVKLEKSKINKLLFRQIEAYSYFGFNNSNWTKENIEMVSRNIAFSWPFTFEKNIDQNFLYLGKNNKQSIILDIWKRNHFHSNSNCVFFGTSGRGKTTAIKKIALDFSMQKNSTVIIVDPQREYQIFKNILDLSWIDIGSGTTTINPLEILNINLKNKRETIIGKHISFFINWIKILSNTWSEEKETIILNSLKVLYKKWGFYDNNLDISNLTSNDYPTISEWIRILRAIKYNDKNYENIYLNEKIKLIEWLKTNFEDFGIYSKNYNGYTNVELNNNFIVIDSKTFVENSTKNNVNAFFYLIFQLILNKININFFNENKKTMLIFDELHKFINNKNSEVLDFLFDIAKTIRKFNGSLVVSTQNISDFILNDEIINKTSGILKNSQYKFIFNVPGDDIKIINKLYNPDVTQNSNNLNLINENDFNFILNAGVGECLLISTQKRKIHFKFDYNEYEKQQFFV
ncbi:Mbov_0397 family ICE element conjugal transfer ATPase [Mesomycoplasma neurolyticum]|uniref:Type IV secretory pathway, VirB4 components n=1 Tax=Mesomycoplasma neurolyticum TaxID=2120 RepID=A0A449A4Q6_9BACT|nr:type IV secretion system DNA-binding domain-containing protein [Mesomycoplasma neurolyticum]VEU59219.1 Type IV secretory pathway, VirB4 components [Mesomycoplasma neurolyticum]